MIWRPFEGCVPERGLHKLVPVSVLWPFQFLELEHFWLKQWEQSQIVIRTDRVLTDRFRTEKINLFLVQPQINDIQFLAAAFLSGVQFGGDKFRHWPRVSQNKWCIQHVLCFKESEFKNNSEIEKATYDNRNVPDFLIVSLSFSPWLESSCQRANIASDGGPTPELHSRSHNSNCE